MSIYNRGLMFFIGIIPESSDYTEIYSHLKKIINTPLAEKISTFTIIFFSAVGRKILIVHL